MQDLSGEDIKSGGWFAKLLTYSLRSYSQKVDWQYFKEKYKGIPPDAIVEERIRMAARYAAIEGGLSASAYTGAIAATIGTGGGASPATVPAAVTTMMVDVTYTTQLQLRLAYDIAVLYGVPVDLNDPGDLWKLIRVAFTIKSGEVASEGALKSVPLVVRPLIKRFLAGDALKAAKALPVVGKYLLRRNVIKVGIPAVGVPLSVVVNRQTTLIAGRHARAVFRNEARIIEVAEKLSRRTQHPRLLLWVAWLMTMADGKITEDETLLLRHLVRLVRDECDVVDDELERVVVLEPEEVWQRFEATEGDLVELVRAAERVAAIDEKVNAKERALLEEIRDRCER